MCTLHSKDQYETEPKKRVDGIAQSTKFEDRITSDHKVRSVRNVSRCGHKECPNRARCVHEVESEPSHEHKGNVGNNVLLAKFPSARTNAGKDFHSRFEGVRESVKI